MANTPSASKRILITERNRLQNRFYKSSVRTLVKLFGQQLDVYETSQNTDDKIKAQKILNSTYSMIDKGCKRNVFHKNTAARKKSKLAAQLKAI